MRASGTMPERPSEQRTSRSMTSMSTRVTSTSTAGFIPRARRITFLWGKALTSAGEREWAFRCSLRREWSSVIWSSSPRRKR